MKCFHFTSGERREEEDGVVSRVSKVSWARSLSIASSSADVRRSEFDFDSRDLSDSVSFHEFLAQRRANDLRVFTFSELKSATRGFSRALMVGEGGFGCVYRGVVRVHADDAPDSKMDVAVKQLNRNGFQGHKEWINEVNFLGVVKHPNLVKLVGYCAEDDERGIQRLLVYELMRNKILEDHLLARVPSSLSWMTRLKIAQDAARGLAYLHEEMDFQLSLCSLLKPTSEECQQDYYKYLNKSESLHGVPLEVLSQPTTPQDDTMGGAKDEDDQIQPGVYAAAMENKVRETW